MGLSWFHLCPTQVTLSSCGEIGICIAFDRACLPNTQEPEISQLGSCSSTYRGAFLDASIMPEPLPQFVNVSAHRQADVCVTRHAIKYKISPLDDKLTAAEKRRSGRKHDGWN